MLKDNTMTYTKGMKKEKLNKVELGNKIRKYRLLKKITQEEFAILLDLSSVHISQMERGENTPSLQTFIGICDVLDVEPTVLLSGSLPLVSNDIDERKKYLYKIINTLNEDEAESVISLIKTFKSKR